MKPTSPFIIERRLARHDHRACSRRAYSAGDSLFRPQADPNVRPIQPRADEASRGDFRRMSAEMLECFNRSKAGEIVVFAFVIALTAWPLLSLLMLMAETVPGFGW
jgi:hypothetical protein